MCYDDYISCQESSKCDNILIGTIFILLKSADVSTVFFFCVLFRKSSSYKTVGFY